MPPRKNGSSADEAVARKRFDVNFERLLSEIEERIFVIVIALLHLLLPRKIALVLDSTSSSIEEVIEKAHTYAKFYNYRR